jgi:hypothetical protein
MTMSATAAPSAKSATKRRARSRIKRALQVAVITAAAVVAIFPPAAATVERFYARLIYPFVQTNLTSLSNETATPLFDVTVITTIVMVIGGWIFWIARARHERSLRPIGRGLAAMVTVAAVTYLWFLGAWGFNYARPPLETLLPYDASRVTPAAVRVLAEHAVDAANRTHAAAHGAGFPALRDAPPALAAALHDVEREFGRRLPTVIAAPKQSLLGPFFRASGVSGMLAPFFLETLLNTDLTGPERPVVLAHEWAHLSGYAPESDASFVGYLAALRAGPAAEYSAWLDLVAEATNQLHPVTRGLVLERLADGPRRDQEAIRERLQALVAPVERVTWSTYDQMLKSQGVEEGVQSYSRVIQLLLGTNALQIDRPPAAATPAVP